LVGLGVPFKSDGESIMMRKMAIALAAVAALTFGAASDVSAHGGGGGGGHGGGFGGGFGHGGMGGFGHAESFHSGSFGHFGGPGFHDGRFAFHGRFHGRRFRDGFFFAGDPFWYDDDNGYDDACYRHVWTRWGWEWAWICN
jgi:hypothetical protein